MYVFDNSPLSTLFRNYYRNRFPSLWNNFRDVVNQDGLVSTREAFREIMDGQITELREWAENNQGLFATPTAAEGAVVARIYAVPHFQQNLEQQKLLKGGRNADAFVIARASVENRTVVTMEKFKANAAKIPNICRHLGVRCMTLEEFMEAEKWQF
ncbi:MAG: PIN domain-containing protein [Xanthobacteraceae bacterium]